MFIAIVMCMSVGYPSKLHSMITLQEGGLNQLANISNDFGQVKYQNAAAKKADQATAQTQGSFIVLI